MNTEIAEYSPTAAALAELRQKYENAVFEVSTPNGMALAIAARRACREPRIAVEKLRKEIKQPALDRCRLIDSEAKELIEQLVALEDRIDKQIKAEEQRKADEKTERERIERERVEALYRRVVLIREQPTRYVGKPATEIAAKIAALSGVEIGADYAELQGDAHAAKAEAIATLTEMHAKAQEQEREAERLRVERAELEAQRKAQEEQAERDRAELAKLRAEAAARQAAINAELDRKIAEEAERAAAVRAEHDARIAAEEAKRVEEEAELARQRAEIEEQRRKVEAERLAQEEAARKIQSGYEALEDFVDRFLADPEFRIVASYIAKWLCGRREDAAVDARKGKEGVA